MPVAEANSLFEIPASPAFFISIKTRKRGAISALLFFSNLLSSPIDSLITICLGDAKINDLYYSPKINKKNEITNFGLIIISL